MTGKAKLHPRNQHLGGYDFERLVGQTPALVPFVTQTPAGQPTIDFKDPDAVRMLNRALLKTHYDIDHWDIPPGYLCPPIPGRVDYIHHLADLLAEADTSHGLPRGRQIKVLDIGTGASLVYPLTGQSEYGWQFTGVDVDAGAIKSARQICKRNQLNIDLRVQDNAEHIFRGVIQHGDAFHLTMCNPPFHGSREQATKGTRRKWASLGQGHSTRLNFGGRDAELWYPGGEIKFIARMIKESTAFGTQCLWFTSLVSKRDNLSPIRRILGRARVAEYKIVEMAQGQKTSRFVAWTYIKKSQRAGFGVRKGRKAPAPR